MADEREQQEMVVRPPTSRPYSLPIEYFGAGDVLATYADAAVVSHTDKDFSLFFFQATPPMSTVGTQLQEIQTARARCVARIVFTPKVMLELFRAMLGNMQHAGLMDNPTEEEQSSEQENK